MRYRPVPLVTRRDEEIQRARYKLQRLSEEKAGWVTLAAYTQLDRALEQGPRRSGHVRVIAGKGERVVIAWRNGKVISELETRT